MNVEISGVISNCFIVYGLECVKEVGINVVCLDYIGFDLCEFYDGVFKV